MENLFQLHFTGGLFDQPMPERYPAHRERDNLGKEPAAAKRLSTLPAVVRQPLASNKNIISRGTNSPFPLHRGNISHLPPRRTDPRRNLQQLGDSKEGGLVNPGLRPPLQFCLKSVKAKGVGGRNPAKGFSSHRRWFIFLRGAARSPRSPNCRLLSRGRSGKCSPPLRQLRPDFLQNKLKNGARRQLEVTLDDCKVPSKRTLYSPVPKCWATAAPCWAGVEGKVQFFI